MEKDGHTPCDVLVGLAECFGEVFDGQRDGEEIKGIPGPSAEGYEEEHPLLEVEEAEEANWVLDLGHGRFEGGEPRGEVVWGRHGDGHEQNTALLETKKEKWKKTVFL
jgi:hypothetical protein